MLRITGGHLKNRRLTVPGAIRPTQEKVRQALFNILGSFIEEARVLDGYAGSGALGFEALSRGAAFVAFVESDTGAVLSIRENLERLADDVPRSAWRLVHLDAVQGIRELAGSEPPFDVVLLDPPYRTDEAKKALNALIECAMVSPHGLVAVEHPRSTVLPTVIGQLHQRTQHRYGDTVLSFYQPS